jgi:hypothetical protein
MEWRKNCTAGAESEYFWMFLLSKEGNLSVFEEFCRFLKPLQREIHRVFTNQLLTIWMLPLKNSNISPENNTNLSEFLSLWC